jgi:hypothetical protein
VPGPGLEFGYRSAGFGETAGNLYFELEAGVMYRGSGPGNDPAREKPKHDPVRVVQYLRVDGAKAQRSGSRHSRLHRAANLRCFHAF